MNGRDVARFLLSLTLDIPLPEGFGVMNPYNDPEVQHIVRTFCDTYYSSPAIRLPMFGINPGRLGGGITGLSFTDPFAVASLLGIESTVQGRREPSATFIYEMIAAYGGPNAFYNDVFLSAWSPLGFVRDGVNINFYDDKGLIERILPSIVSWCRQTIELGVSGTSCIVLGLGTLQKVVEKQIRPHLPFEHVIYLEHPRYIMQYKRTSMDMYIAKYVDAIRSLKKL